MDGFSSKRKKDKTEYSLVVYFYMIFVYVVISLIKILLLAFQMRQAFLFFSLSLLFLSKNKHFLLSLFIAAENFFLFSARFINHSKRMEKHLLVHLT